MTEKRALLIIDMQDFFFEENKEVNKHQLSVNCRDIAAIARDNGIPVIHIWTVYRDDRNDWPSSWSRHGDIWCEHLVRGSSSSHIVSDIPIHKEDIVVEKRRFSAFYNTNLDDILRKMSISHIDVVGYSADVCIRFTSVDAYNRGYDVTLIREGMESFKEPTDNSIEYLRWTIDASAISIDEYRSTLKGK